MHTERIPLAPFPLRLPALLSHGVAYSLNEDTFHQAKTGDECPSLCSNILTSSSHDEYVKVSEKE
jgi:hypothetical protein